MNRTEPTKNKQKSKTGLIEKIVLAALGIGCIAAVGLVEGKIQKQYPTHIYNADDGILLEQPQKTNELSGTMYIVDSNSKLGYRAIDLSALNLENLTLNYGKEPKKTL